jgi:hypothetical protein
MLLQSQSSRCLVAFVLATLVLLLLNLHPAIGTTSGVALSEMLARHHSSRCPQALPPTPGAALAAAEAVSRAASLFRGRDEHPYVITAEWSLGATAPHSVAVYRAIAAHLCGPTVAKRSWVVVVTFPRLVKISADLSYGIVFVARTPHGWRVWYRFH